MSKQIRDERRKQAKADLPQAKEMAIAQRITLMQKSEIHYQLTNGEWLINIYPTTCKVLIDTKRPLPGFDVEPSFPNWRLIDVVELVAKNYKAIIGIQI